VGVLGSLSLLACLQESRDSNSQYGQKPVLQASSAAVVKQLLVGSGLLSLTDRLAIWLGLAEVRG
jgi:hypothetical protein